MTLKNILSQLLAKKISLSKNKLTIIFDIPSHSVDQELQTLAYALLNGYGHHYLFIFKGLPPCTLLGAHRHCVYKAVSNVQYTPINSCSTCALRKSCPGWRMDIQRQSLHIHPIQDKPLEIAIEITGQCNLHCQYCTSATRANSNLSLSTAKRLLDDARTNAVPDIRFTGGEPLLHPDLAPMLSYAKSKGFYTILNTNATLLSQSHLKALSGTVDCVLVSLQGFNTASDRQLTHASISFLNKIQNILLLRSHLPAVRIGTVITPLLLSNWDRYVALIKRIRPYTWALFRPMFEDPSKSNLTMDDYKILLDRLFELNKAGISAKISNSMPFCIHPDLSVSASTMLGSLSDDGHTRLIWDLQGFYKPSYFINKNLGTDIASAWDAPFIRKIHAGNFLAHKCKRCSFLNWCQGGSRFLAWKTHASCFANDPFFDLAVKKDNHH